MLEEPSQVDPSCDQCVDPNLKGIHTCRGHHLQRANLIVNLFNQLPDDIQQQVIERLDIEPYCQGCQCTASSTEACFCPCHA
jgi:hypothetical protein